MNNWAKNMFMISALIVAAFMLAFAKDHIPYLNEIFDASYRSINFMK